MLGQAADPGIIPRVMKSIFEKISSEKRTSSVVIDVPETTVHLSYLEIYNEKVRDLMVPDSTDLPIREDSKHKIFVAGLTEKVVDSFETFSNLFGPACNNRSVAATNLNQHSSRSHSIVLLKVTRRFKDKELVGKIHLIDLAGSEDNRRTGNKGIRLKESGAINRSLFALGEVVDAINKNLARVPYRNSKLTRLLQDSLGGSCHSLMVTNVAPEEHYYYDTYCTLNFASKSKKIINTAVINVNSLVPKTALKRAGFSDSNLVSGAKKVKRQASCCEIRTQTASSSSSSSLSLSCPEQSAVSERIDELENNMNALRKLVQEKRSMEETELPSEPRRRSARLSSASSAANSSSLFSDSDMEASLRQIDECLKMTPASVRSDDSPDIIDATPIIDKRKNALKDRGNFFLHGLGKQKKKLSKHFKRILDSGPSCSPLFQDFPSRNNKIEKNATPSRKDEAQSQFDPIWQQSRNESFLKTLNSAEPKDLQRDLQTVGAKRAKLIFEWRQVHGPFATIEAVKDIPGISDKDFERLLKRNLITL